MTGVLRPLLRLIEPPRARVLTSVTLGALVVLFGVGLMATAGYLISRAAERPAVLSLMVAIVGVRFFGLGRPVVRYAERVSSHDTALRILARTRRRVYERLEPLAPAELGQYRDGDLLARLVGDIDGLQNLHIRGLNPPLVALIAAGVSAGAAAAFLPAAGLVLLGGLVLAGAAAPAAAAAVARKQSRRLAAIRGETGADIVELLTGSAELVVCGAADERLERLRRADRRLAHAARRAALADGLGDAIRIAVTGATVAGVLAVSVVAHSAGRLDRVSIGLLALLALAAFEAVQPLGQAARELGESLAAGRRILELTERAPSIHDPALPFALPPRHIAVAVESVSARYGPNEPLALRRVTIRIEPRRRVALIGPSGAGKTTIVNLLLRFLDPEEGCVTLAGRDLRAYRQEDVRRAIAVVPQDPHLFSTSIRENVRVGRPDAHDRAVEDALRRAGMPALPDGLDTPVGELGRELSGGQRQRIAIARALIADSPVLVLDEPTAHLDSPSAQALLEDVLSGAGDRSVLLITHRPEGMELVDDVYVLG
jgi:thiol reductant ABC exporter CydC subunit